MLAFVTGELVAIQRGDRQRVTVGVQGLGYQLLVPDRLLKALPPIGEVVTLHTHLAVRENDVTLYGFGSSAERELFGALIKVNGVGPALGLALLSTLSLPDLVQALITGNVRLLGLTPGVGPKMAQRLVLELKTKMAAWRTEVGAVVTVGGPPLGIYEEVEMALLALGYRPTEITEVFQSLGQTSPPEETVEAWLRAAIAHLSRNV